MKILLVEDHPESRLNLQRLIERRGHEVLGVGSAEEAKQALQTQSYQFLILDWMLPDMDGLELASKVSTTKAYEVGDKNAALRIAVDRCGTCAGEAEQRARATPALREAIDRIWRRILIEER